MATTVGGTTCQANLGDDDESLLALPLKHGMFEEYNDTPSQIMDHEDQLDLRELFNDAPELHSLMQILEGKDDDIASFFALGAHERDEHVETIDDAQKPTVERRLETTKEDGKNQTALSQIPFAKITDPKRLASHLRQNYTAFATLDEQCIIQLLKQGAKAGLQPKVSQGVKQQAQHSHVLPNRRGKKRGAYKMRKKDSWTLTQNGGASQSALQNATQNKRSPPSIFKKRYLYVNEIELNRESMGEAEVRL